MYTRCTTRGFEHSDLWQPGPSQPQPSHSSHVIMYRKDRRERLLRREAAQWITVIVHPFTFSESNNDTTIVQPDLRSRIWCPLAFILHPLDSF